MSFWRRVLAAIARRPPYGYARRALGDRAVDDFVLRMREVAARQAAEIDEQGRR